MILPANILKLFSNYYNNDLQHLKFSIDAPIYKHLVGNVHLKRCTCILDVFFMSSNGLLWWFDLNVLSTKLLKGNVQQKLRGGQKWYKINR